MAISLFSLTGAWSIRFLAKLKSPTIKSNVPMFLFSHSDFIVFQKAWLFIFNSNYQTLLCLDRIYISERHITSMLEWSLDINQILMNHHIILVRALCSAYFWSHSRDILSYVPLSLQPFVSIWDYCWDAIDSNNYGNTCKNI